LKEVVARQTVCRVHFESLDAKSDTPTIDHLLPFLKFGLSRLNPIFNP